MLPFIIASKTLKHLGVNLVKEVKGLYTGNYEHQFQRNWIQKWVEIFFIFMNWKS